MNADKKCFKTGWDKINSTNFMSELNPKHNGFAILTGDKYIMIDIDLKHNPPQEIYDCLYANCKAVERTPGGYHFWFLNDTRTSHFASPSGAYWNNKETQGLDIRNTGGIAYCCPTRYVNTENTLVRYTWVKGNLSLCESMPTEVLEHLHYEETSDYDEPFNFTVQTTDPTNSVDDISLLLEGLSVSRVDNYSEWITVGMALKNSGYECDMWDNWSQLSSKYRHGECLKKWNSFKEKGKSVTLATLYHWLKHDNYALFIKLRSKNNEIIDKLLSATNSGVAEAFYMMNPDKYLVFDTEAYYLGDNNVWIKSKSAKTNDIPRIRKMLQKDCLEMLHTLEKNTGNTIPDSSVSQIESVSKISKFESSEKIKQIQRIKNKLESTAFLNSTIELLRDHYYKDGDPITVFNINFNLFAFDNCVFDTEQLIFRKIQPDDYISVTCGYDYRDATQDEKNLVIDFLMKLWPSKEVAVYMLKAISTSLLGYNHDEFFHVLAGKGANGKSSLIDLCSRVFGKYSFDLPYTYITKKIEGVAPPLPALVNAKYTRFVFVSEPDEDDKFQIPCLKRYTGGDTCSVRTLYGEEVTFKPQYKIWICTNGIPELSSYDGAIHRRMRIVPFTTRFCHEPRAENEQPININLKKEIKSDDRWKYGFLGLLLDAFQEMNGQTLFMPKAVVDMTEGYMMKNNPVGAWLKKFYDITNNKEDIVPRCELYGTFLEDTNVQMSHKKFSDILENKCNINDKKVQGKHYYYGIKRKDNIDSDIE
jgi:P4 family phage/plasmid primase-like protien